MGSNVTEIDKTEHRSAQTDSGSIERGDQNFGMLVKAAGEVHVVGTEAGHDLTADNFRWYVIIPGRSCNAYICASGEKAPCAGKNGDIDVVQRSDVAEEVAEAVVVLLSQGIELFRAVERDDCDRRLESEGDIRFNFGKITFAERHFGDGRMVKQR